MPTRDRPDLVKVGCCGFPRRLAEYVKTFPVVEVQQTFYRLPRVTTVQRWRAAAPEGFEFAMKAWQIITHPPSSPTYRRSGLDVPAARRGRYGAFAPTDEVAEACNLTLKLAQALGATALVFQCPASFTPTREHIANLRRFFQQIPRGRIRFAWEPRGPWPQEQIERLCKDLDIIHCVDPFTGPSVYGTPRYYRLHGRTGFRYAYSDDDLEALQCWCRGPTYALFNNMTMWDDARRFLARLPPRFT